MNMGKLNEKLEYLLSIANRNGLITNWHLSDDLEGFMKKFYSNETKLLTAKREFTRCAGILVKKGLLEKAHRMRLSENDWFTYGTRTQTIWSLKTKNK